MSAGRPILTVARERLPAAWLPAEGAVELTWPVLLEALAAAEPRWMARNLAEHDPSRKQPIPYVLLRDGAGRLAAYRRAGSERRLHGRWSLGAGGHVERDDEAETLGATLFACARRELDEELDGFSALEEPRFLGVINEELTEVGTVHWGLVFLAEAGEPPPRGGAELGELRWLERGAAEALALERWSRLALRLCPAPGGAGGR